MARPESESQMSLGDHLEELRRRLFLALGGLIPLAILGFVFGKELLNYVLGPVRSSLIAHGESPLLIATGPLETFSTYMKIALIAAALVGSPWLLYQLWRFVAPGLYAHERRFVYFLLPLSAVLTACGVVFLFKIIMPLMLSFFIEFGSGLGAPPIPTAPLPEGTVMAHITVLAHDPPDPKAGDMWFNNSEMLFRICVGYNGNTPVIMSGVMHRDLGVLQEYRVSEYFKLLLSLAMGFAAAFQAPVVVLLLGWAGIIDRTTLRKYRKQAIFVCAIASALLTPGDPASMLLMLVPLYGLYELGGVLLKYFPAGKVAGKKPGDNDDRDDKSDSGDKPDKDNTGDEEGPDVVARPADSSLPPTPPDPNTPPTPGGGG